ncbi:MAG: DNA polymerase Y family protein, partial [Planctomycetes bacterium]|nr:DNA polymerase Y family protein [Planctomycetota bacterium]
RIGMSLAHAGALIRGGVIAVTWNPESDARSLQALAAWCNRFTPTVGVDPPDGLVLDVTGTHRLHRGEPRLLEMIRRSMVRLGLRARLAIASTIGCARAVARYGDRECISIQPGAEAACLRTMPLEAMNITPTQLDSLRDLGFDGIGSILDLPRSTLPARFGTEVLTFLDEALGHRAEVIVPVRPREALHVEHAFEGPTSHWESIERCVCMLVENLVATLNERGLGVRRLDACLAVANRQSPAQISLTLCRHSRDARHLWSMLRPHLERADFGDGIEGITLAATRTGIIEHAQRRLPDASGDNAVDSPHHDDPHAARAMLCDTLASRLGADAVLRVFHVESHVPERTLRLATVMQDRPSRDTARVNMTPRPSRLFLQPEPIQVMHMSPDGPIHRLHWRGSMWNVTRCAGPERICSQWWLASPGETCDERDYYRVRIATDGQEPRWIWIYRLSVSDTWHAHGEWA